MDPHIHEFYIKLITTKNKIRVHDTKTVNLLVELTVGVQELKQVKEFIDLGSIVTYGNKSIIDILSKIWQNKLAFNKKNLNQIIGIPMALRKKLLNNIMVYNYGCAWCTVFNTKKQR